MNETRKRGALESDERVRITEIFHSIQGESRPAGFPTAFVRLTGCPLRCVFCDTAYAFHGGNWLTTQEILAQVQAFGARYVCVTGGEPLAQPNCPRLLIELANAGYAVSLETSGALSIADLDPRITVVMDVKTPGSGECDKNLAQNLDLLRENDQLKFVICDRADFEWSKIFCVQNDLLDRCSVLFSPSQGQLEARILAEWILEEKLQVRFQVQLHKYLWGDEPGH